MPDPNSGDWYPACLYHFSGNFHYANHSLSHRHILDNQFHDPPGTPVFLSILLKIPGPILSVIIRTAAAVIGIFPTAHSIIKRIPKGITPIINSLIQRLINTLAQFLVIFFFTALSMMLWILSPSSSNSLYPIFSSGYLFHNACFIIIQKSPSKNKTP